MIKKIERIVSLGGFYTFGLIMIYTYFNLTKNKAPLWRWLLFVLSGVSTVLLTQILGEIAFPEKLTWLYAIIEHLIVVLLNNALISIQIFANVNTPLNDEAEENNAEND